MAVEEALAQQAPALLQEPMLALRLDALGERFHPQPVADLDDGSDHAPRARLLGHAEEERPVDLEDVRGQVLQPRERRVAGSEVVDGQAQARRLQVRQHALGPAQVGHRARLGDLDDDGRGVDAAVPDPRGDPGRQVRLPQLAQ